MQSSSSTAGSPPHSEKSRTVGTPAFSVDQSEARIAWVSQASCRGIDPDQLFVRGAAQRKAATICRHCPVLMQCAADALDNRVEFGVWGGMTERQRRALLKQHPEVDSRAEFFERQRARQHAV
ncbi:WhiB family transcriptional regulator [Rhodococcus sp. D2-41]|uniref:WhiB family transcriptional regulator n=1 Tax=Speluncibacter jeojiensis TaxID=2710754 RepID=UPI003852CE3F|nr:WhiB family transcriptional regulator [Rhodococcus sp. D2-41]